MSRSKRGVEGPEKGSGARWRRYCDANGAANLTFGALNVTPYTGIHGASPSTRSVCVFRVAIVRCVARVRRLPWHLTPRG